MVTPVNAGNWVIDLRALQGFGLPGELPQAIGGLTAGFFALEGLESAAVLVGEGQLTGGGGANFGHG